MELAAEIAGGLTYSLAAIFFALSLIFVWRSSYAMRIGSVKGV